MQLKAKADLDKNPVGEQLSLYGFGEGLVYVINL